MDFDNWLPAELHAYCRLGKVHVDFIFQRD